jgi:hypothetical protein
MHQNYFARRPCRTEVADANRSRSMLSSIALVAALAANAAVAGTPPPRCDLRLTVELTPDVPKARDAGFLSSLLSNDLGYQLTLQQQRDGSIIVVELTGPGPGYRCQNAIERIRKDGRVLSVHVQRASRSNFSARR